MRLPIVSSICDGSRRVLVLPVALELSLLRLESMESRASVRAVPSVALMPPVETSLAMACATGLPLDGGGRWALERGGGLGRTDGCHGAVASVECRRGKFATGVE